MVATLRGLIEVPVIRAATIVIASVVVGVVAEWTIRRTLVILARRTTTTLDDTLVEAVRRPIVLSVVLLGLAWAADELISMPHMLGLVYSILETLAVVFWSGAAFRIGVAVLETLSRRGGGASMIQSRTIPVFDMLLKVVVVGASVYFAFLAWQIDLTAWLASAGIIGIAIGFAAKDTLANLFSGIFIVADAPYKLGDFIVLDGNLRGQVTRIGIRSTRVLTRDDIEVTVPNSLIASSKIVNETGGPDIKQRVRVGVDCAYGSDIDKIREVLLACPEGAPHIAPEPVPQVRFLEFGSSGLRFELRVWIEQPAMRGRVLDELHCRIYKAFQTARIEIPYSKHDVYIKELPVALPGR